MGIYTTENMRFYLINRYFYPDESATALLLTDLAEDLARSGHEVHVFTSRQLYNSPKVNLPAFQKWQGVNIHRVFSTTFGRGTFLGRLADISTYRMALLPRKKWDTPDVWFVMTDPPFLLEKVVRLRKKLGGRIVHHVDDVYPDLAMALGAISSGGILGNWLNLRASKALRECDTVLALGECMAEVLKKKGIPENRIRITPPWADGTRLFPLPHKENAFRKELGLSNQDFVVMYSGNMGKGHRFESFLKVAKALADEKEIHFVFIGDGAKKKEIQWYCKEYDLRNCRLLPYQPRERLRESLSAGDVHLISLDSRVQGLIVPSKLAGILAVGKPVIFVGDSRNSVAHAILKGKCGYVIPDGNIKQIQKKILKLKKDCIIYNTFGNNARHLFEKTCSRSIVVSQILSYLENSINI